MWKDFFYFTKKERQGLLLLTFLIGGVIAGKRFIPEKQNQETENVENIQVENSSSNPENSVPEQERKYLDNNKPRTSKSDFQEQRTYYKPKIDTAKQFETANSKDFKPVEKFAPGTKIDLNRADTADLVKIPGIGQSYASRILKYRKLLGGYYSVVQLQEVYGMYEELFEKMIPFLEISTDQVTLIPVNTSSVERLKSHPYINFYQAKAMVDLRKKKGKISSISELSLLEEFPEEDLEKIKNYLSFD